GGNGTWPRAALRRPGRRPLGGLLTDTPAQVLPEGAQLVAEPRALEPRPKTPVPMLGHVTSSYFSPTCGRSIALALVEVGIARIGQTLFAPLPAGCARVRVTAPRFVTDSGEVLDA